MIALINETQARRTLAMLFVFLCAVCQAWPATRLVTSTADDGSPGTLRYEVAHSQDGDVIAITTTGTLIVTSGNISFASSITITVQSVTQATIDGNNNSRIFQVEGGTVTFANLVLQNGNASSGGGGIFIMGGDVRIDNCVFDGNDGGVEGGALGIDDFVSTPTVFATSCTFRNNFTSDGEGGQGGAVSIIDSRVSFHYCSFASNTALTLGGAVYLRRSAVTFANCEISTNNQASRGGGLFADGATVQLRLQATIIDGNSATRGGGGLYSEDAMIRATGCTIRNNRAQGNLNGGGVYLDGSLVQFDYCSISSNTAQANGGAAYIRSGMVTFANCEVSTNSAVSNGGSLFVGTGASLTLKHSTFDDNAADYGGALFSIGNGEVVRISSCTFANNRATNSGGAIGNEGGTITIASCSFYNNRTLNSLGGAIEHDSGTTVITTSTFSANSSGTDGGAIATDGEGLGIFNSTFSANTANESGGAIDSPSAVDIINVTFTGNVADNDNNGTGDGGAIRSSTGMFKSNLVAGNIDRGGEFPDIASNVMSDGFNLIGDVGNLDFSNNTSGDKYGDPNATTTPNAGASESSAAIDPLLAPLADNGGFTLTHALQPGSPAINASTTAGTSLLDQRGALRFGAPDIGAFEASLVAVSIAGPTAPCARLGTNYSTEFFADASYTWQVTGATITAGQGTTSATVIWTGGTAASITVSVSFGGSPLVTTLSVMPTLNLPQLDYVLTDENLPVTLNVLANDLGAGLQLASVGAAIDGSVIFASSGSLTYTPNAGFTGLEIFSYTVDNGMGCIASGEVVVAVAPIEDAEESLKYIEREKDKAGGVRGLRRVAAVAVSRDGRHVYAAGRTYHSIVIFERNSTTGSISYLGRVRNGSGGVQGLKNVIDVAVSSDGQNVYAAGYGGDAVAVFARNPLTGALSFLEQKKQGATDGGASIDGLRRPIGIALSPGGRSLYVSGHASNALAVFRRNSTTGSLSFLECHKDGRDGVDGLKGAYGIAVSVDGKTVYATGHKEHKVAVFARSLTSGSLSFVECHKDGSGGVDGLRGAIAVTVSPDARSVYVAGNRDKALAVFKRDTSGSLSFLERLRDGLNGTDGLNGAFDVAVSGDGANVYAVGASDRALAMFQRDSEGKLSYLSLHRDGQAGVDGLNGVRGLSVSADSRHIYCAGTYDNAVSAFFRNRQPQAADDITTVALNSARTVLVLLNDSDPDSHALTITNVTGASLGTATISGGGTTIDYSAGAVAGADSFSYTIEDGHGGSSTASVSVNVVLVKSGVEGPAWDSGSPPVPETAAFVNNGGGRLVSATVNPNPVRDEARLNFALDRATHLRISISDMHGRIIARLADADYGAGSHTLSWRVTLDRAARLSAGSYLIVLQEVNQQEVPQRWTLPFIVLP